MATYIKGTTFNKNSSKRIPKSIVRLYDRDTGLLEDDVISNGENDYPFSSADYGFGVSPQNYFITAFHPNDGSVGYIQGSHTESINVRSIQYHIGGVLTDTNIDIIKVKIPSVAGIGLQKIKIESQLPADTQCRIDIRNTAGGGGDGLIAQILKGKYEGYGVGSITSATYFYIRIVEPGNNITELSIDLWYIIV